MAVPDERLLQILDQVKEFCLSATGNPVASILLSSRDWLGDNWLTCRSIGIAGNCRFARHYVLENQGWDKIYFFLPDRIQDIEHCRQVSSTVMFHLGRVLLSHGTTPPMPSVGEPGEFVKGFAVSGVTKRGFVASRVRHTLLGLRHICSRILAERSHFLESKILPMLNEFLGWQDHVNE